MFRTNLVIFIFFVFFYALSEEENWQAAIKVPLKSQEFIGHSCTVFTHHLKIKLKVIHRALLMHKFYVPPGH